MTRRHFIWFVLVVAFVIMVVLIFVGSKKVRELAKEIISPSESAELLSANQNIINNASAQAGGNIPVVSESDHILGDAKAKVILVVYENLSDKYSAEYGNILSQARNEFGSSLAIVFRPFFASNDKTGLAVQIATECAGKQGKYIEMRETLFIEKKYDNASIVDFSSKLGLNEEAFKKCLNDEKIGSDIVSNIKSVKDIVFGAPTTFLDGEIIVGARPMDNITSSAGESLEGLRSIINRHLVK
jgi:protein-disulfide isomerase